VAERDGVPAIRPVVLIVMDGYGCNPRAEGNAIAQAKRPVLSHLWATCPHTELGCYGLAVGLPEGQMGNSEVGHLNIGAGRIVDQDIVRISKSIEHNELDKNPCVLYKSPSPRDPKTSRMPSSA